VNKSLQPFTGIPRYRSTARSTRAYKAVNGMRWPVSGLEALLCGSVAFVAQTPNPYRRSE
jgi:hypothetical protein